ncbi:hypothetical protein D9M68_794210 [compost metagenome]
MTEFTQILLIGALLVLAYLLGDFRARRRVGKIGFVGRWPSTHVQFDSSMSQADMLAFLDKVRSMVLAKTVSAQANRTEDGCSDNQGSEPFGGRDD